MWKIRGGGGGMNWEIGTDIYTLIHIKQITNKNLLYKNNNNNKIIFFFNVEDPDSSPLLVPTSRATSASYVTLLKLSFIFCSKKVGCTKKQLRNVPTPKNVDKNESKIALS